MDVLAKKGIPHLDFDFLLQRKETTSAALVGQASLHWSIDRSKVVLITVYDTNLKRFGFNFIEKVHELVAP